MGTGAGSAGAVALRAAGQAVPSPAFRFIVRKTLTYLRRAYVSVYRY